MKLALAIAANLVLAQRHPLSLIWSFLAPKKQDGDGQNANWRLQQQSTNQWVTSGLLRPLFIQSMSMMQMHFNQINIKKQKKIWMNACFLPLPFYMNISVECIDLTICGANSSVSAIKPLQKKRAPQYEICDFCLRLGGVGCHLRARKWVRFSAGAGLSVWSLHVLPVCAWVLSGFLPQSKDMQVSRLTG